MPSIYDLQRMERDKAQSARWEAQRRVPLEQQLEEDRKRIYAKEAANQQAERDRYLANLQGRNVIENTRQQGMNTLANTKLYNQGTLATEQMRQQGAISRALEGYAVDREKMKLDADTRLQERKLMNQSDLERYGSYEQRYQDELTKPVYKDVIIGYDDFGKPIMKTENINTLEQRSRSFDAGTFDATDLDFLNSPNPNNVQTNTLPDTTNVDMPAAAPPLATIKQATPGSTPKMNDIIKRRNPSNRAIGGLGRQAYVGEDDPWKRFSSWAGRNINK